MDNPLKNQPLAILCTPILQNRASPLWRKTGPWKERDSIGEQEEGFEKNLGLEKPCTWLQRERLLPHALLRRDSEEEPLRSPAVSVNHFPKQRSKMELGSPSKTEKIARYLLPSHGPLWGNGKGGQIIPPSQHGMSALEPFQDHHEPTGHQPGGDQTLRIHLYRGAMETSLPHLPASQAQDQRPQDRVKRVLEIGNQLDG